MIPLLPPWPLSRTSRRKPWAIDARHDVLDERRHGFGAECDGAGKTHVVGENPNQGGGSTATRPGSRFAASSDSACASIVSVPTGRCRPCCSTEPSGSTTSVALAVERRYLWCF